MANHEALKANAAKCLSVLLDFVVRECSPLSSDEEGALRAVRAHLAGFDRFRQERWREIRQEVDANDWMVACVSCEELAMVVSGTAGTEEKAAEGEYGCLFCHQVADAEMVADFYAVSMRVPEPVMCQTCYTTALVVEQDFQTATCFRCCEKLRGVEECSHCGGWFEEESMVGVVCNDCFHAVVQNDRT
jgi:hypothetical protein